jgi:5-methylcytosine-specific restriction endonuclease McrA
MPTKPNSYNPYGAGYVAPRRAVTPDTRPSAPERGYDSTWAKLRRSYIGRYPVCQWPGCTQAADIVDHIAPVMERPDLRLTESNLQSLCNAHHGIKTGKDVRRRRKLGKNCRG